MESPEVQDRSLSEPRDPECAVATVLNQESPSISQSPRLESISPMEDEAETESRSLELPSLCQTGEGKKNVQSVIEVRYWPSPPRRSIDDKRGLCVFTFLFVRFCLSVTCPL